MIKYGLVNYILQNDLINDVIQIIQYNIYILEYEVGLLNYIKEKFIVYSRDNKHYIQGYYANVINYHKNEKFIETKLVKYNRVDYITIQVNSRIEIIISSYYDINNFKRLESWIMQNLKYNKIKSRRNKIVLEIK